MTFSEIVFEINCSGIGIDDMFVIVQCLNNIKNDPEFEDYEMSNKIAHALKHAGVSVTVTSLTDVFAFAVGAVSVRLALLLLFMFHDSYAFWNSEKVFDIFISEYAWLAIFLCVYRHWPWFNLSTPSLLVCCLDVFGRVSSYCRKKWSVTLHNS